MARRRSPEEFFEVFREVQESKKDREEGLEAAPQAGRAQANPESARASAGKPSAWSRVSFLSGPALTVSRMAAFLSVCAAALVVLTSYLIGWQRGWWAREARLRETSGGKAKQASRQAGGAGRQAPSIGDRKLTLATLGSDVKSKRDVAREVAYLNGNREFRKLGLEAYLYRDTRGKYRVCARGLEGMSAPERDRVQRAVRRLRGSSGRTDYEDAGFYPP